MKKPRSFNDDFKTLKDVEKGLKKINNNQLSKTKQKEVKALIKSTKKIKKALCDTRKQVIDLIKEQNK